MIRSGHQSKIQRHSNVHRNAFTVIELMVVLTISSMLVATLLSVTVGIARTTNTTRERMPYDGSAFALQRQLQAEFAASRDIHTKSESLIIDGYFKSSQSGIKHSPTQIIYRVKQLGDTRWVIRREIDLLGTAPDNETVDVVCKDFSHFEYLSQEDTSNAPPQFHIALFKTDTADAADENAVSKPWFRTVLVRHGGAR